MIHAPTAGVNAAAPPTPNGHEFGRLTIGTAAVRLLAADRCPTNRGYFLYDDAPAAIEFGPDPDPATIANALASMVTLLGLAPTAADFARRPAVNGPPSVERMQVSLGAAAAACGHNRAMMRQLVDAGLLTAYRAGGADHRPHLRVYLDDARQAVLLASRHAPTGFGQRVPVVRPARRPAPAASYHPRTANW